MNEMEFIPMKTCLYPFQSRIKAKQLVRKKNYNSSKADNKRKMDLMQIRTDDYAKAVSFYLRDGNVTWEKCRPVITEVNNLYAELKIKIDEEAEHKATEKAQSAESSSPTGSESCTSNDSGRTDTSSENENVGALLDSFALCVNLVGNLTQEHRKNMGEVINCCVRSKYLSFVEKTPLFTLLASMDASLNVLNYLEYYVRKH